MPARVSRSSLPSAPSRPSAKNNKKRKQRSQNAFAIASHEKPDLVKIRQHRLGEVENEEPRQKRQRLTGDDEDGEQQLGSEARRQQHKNVAKGRFDELDVSEGSDSEGNQWTLGQVNDEDDSDIDSDEAFGESDEERFAGMAFRGSSSGRKAKKSGKPKHTKVANTEIDLNEDQEDDIKTNDSKEEADLGEDAVDLAQMLDEDFGEDSGEESEEVPQTRSITGSKSKKANAKNRSKALAELGEHSGSESNVYGVNSADDMDDGSDYSISDAESQDNTVEKLQQLQDVVASLPNENAEGEDQDTGNPRETKLSRARLLATMPNISNLDPALSRSLKKLTTPADSKSGKTDGVVAVPLPKRQQDRIDRQAAYDKAKETLNRWIDTVKHNRRAEHLHFPLQDPQEQNARGADRLLPTSHEKPRNELEDTIQNILKESGMDSRNTKAEEDEILAAEGLETNKMPVEEVMARRAELRKARELLFREEKRAKRIKKIKSKAYRRVHRKEKQKAAQQERDLLSAAGLDLSEDEKERNDRRRAEERVGAKHRESRWAKGMKQSGRTVWDEEARSGFAEMARRDEDLRRRLNGERVENDSDADSASSSDVSDDDEENDFRLRDQLDKASGTDSANKPNLSSLRFMQRADAAKRKQNDEETEQILRELDGKDAASESDNEGATGRRTFGFTKTVVEPKEEQNPKLDFEEGFSSEEDIAANTQEGEAKNEDVAAAAETQNERTSLTKSTKDTLAATRRQPLPANKVKTFDEIAANAAPLEKEKKGWKAVPADAPANTSSWTSIQDTDHVTDESFGPNDEVPKELVEEPLVPSNADLVAAAFGGADVAADFEREKHDAEESEDEKITDNTLPGWGTWTGEGISKREKRQAAQRRQQGRFTTREPGVKRSDRRDAKLDRAIISEKQAKKNAKYLANALPHPYESRQQYERALRMPVGPEWTTKETFQNATTPRVMVKQGIIKPMQRPMV